MSLGYQSQPMALNLAVGSNTVVIPAPTSPQRVRVMALVLVATAAATVQFQSGTTAITGNMSLAANGGVVLPYNQDGWFWTQSGQALEVTVGGTGPVEGTLNYIVM